jgi:hypothetical protein
VEISRPSTTTLVWIEKYPPIYTLLAAFVLLIFLRFNLELVRMVGGIFYSCERVAWTDGTEQISCRRLEKDFFGLGTVEDQTFTGVIGAQAEVAVKTGQTSGQNYSYELHSVSLTTVDGSAVLVEPPQMVAGRRGDPVVMGRISFQINQFLQSNQASWHYTQWYNDLGFSLVMGLFLGAFLVAMAYSIARQLGKITYTLTEDDLALAGSWEGHADGYSRHAASPSWLFNRHDRLGQRQTLFKPDDIIAVKVVRQVVGENANG